jgi:hypothetical protein
MTMTTETKKPCEHCGGTKKIAVCRSCDYEVGDCTCDGDTIPEIGTERCPVCDDRDEAENKMDRQRDYFAEVGSKGWF